MARSLCAASDGPAEDVSAIEQRLADTARYLSSDELEGRGPGSRGIELAAQYIAREFQRLGLRTDLCQGTPFQRFKMTIDASPGANNRLALVSAASEKAGSPATRLLTLGRDFTPLAVGDSLCFDLPLAFVGYGTTDKAAGYDDYAGVDVGGKAVIVLRSEPQNIKGRVSVKNALVLLRRKISNAYQHGAAAVVFCTDQAGAAGQESRQDLLLQVGAAGLRSSHRKMAVVHCRRAVLESAIGAAYGMGLTTLETLLARSQTPRSRSLAPWRIVGQTDIQRVQAQTSNVVAVLPGTSGSNGEAVVVGAHYDHLGRRKLGPHGDKTEAVYPGADDNASGVAVLLELARRLVRQPGRPSRQLVFAAFSGEESGLLGSSYYVSHPVVPLQRTVAMLNLDMVGRLRDDKLYVRGSVTACGWAEWIEQVNSRHGLTLGLRGERLGNSDQLAFYAKKVPILHLFTGRHADYHSPTDTFEKLNVPGMRRVAALAGDLLADLAGEQPRPPCSAVVPEDRLGPCVGVFGDFTRSEPGYAIGVVGKDGPAEQAGLRDGDLVVQLGQDRIGCGDDFEESLMHYAGGEQVRVLVRRAGQSRSFQVTLGSPQHDAKAAAAQPKTAVSSGHPASGE